MEQNRDIFETEHQIFRESFREFLNQEVVPHQEKWEELGIVSRDVWLKAGEMGFLLPNAEEKYGGSEQDDFRLEVIMNEELAYINESGFALALHNSLVAPYLLSFCNEEQ